MDPFHREIPQARGPEGTAVADAVAENAPREERPTLVIPSGPEDFAVVVGLREAESERDRAHAPDALPPPAGGHVPRKRRRLIFLSPSGETGERWIARGRALLFVKTPEYTERLNDLASRREAFAVATVTKTEGSTLAKPGFKILISGRGDVVRGTLGGGCPEGPICEVALRAMLDGSPRVVRVHLVDAAKAVAGTMRESSEDEIYVETDCGGTLEVFVEPMLPTERMIIVGQGGRDDIEDALVHQAKALGFEIVVVDPMPDLREAPDAIVKSAVVDPKTIPIGNRDSIVILTRASETWTSSNRSRRRTRGSSGSWRVGDDCGRIWRNSSGEGSRNPSCRDCTPRSAWTLAPERLRSSP